MKSEGLHGLDVSIRLPLRTRITGLQFKRPYRCYRSVYVFYLNNNKKKDQHLKILCVATSLRILGLPPAIFYAMPAFCYPHDLERASPQFLHRTVFVDPLEIPFTGRHRYEVRVDMRSLIAVFRGSREKKIKVYSSEEFIEKLREGEWGIAVKDLLRVRNVPPKDVLRYLKYEMGAPPDAIEYLTEKRLRQFFRTIAIG